MHIKNKEMPLRFEHMENPSATSAAAEESPSLLWSSKADRNYHVGKC